MERQGQWDLYYSLHDCFFSFKICLFQLFFDDKSCDFEKKSIRFA